jgi:hypothetical protein
MLIIRSIDVDDTAKLLHASKEIKAMIIEEVETPASVMIIEDLCKQGIMFASFGT